MVWCFKGVFSVFQGYLKEIEREFQWSFKCVSRVLDCVSRMFQGCSKKVFRVLQWHFKGVNRKFLGCFKKVSRVFQRSFIKESSKGVQVRWKGISSSFKGVSRVLERCSTGMSVKFQWCFNSVSRVFQGCFQEVSRRFQESFKGISRKFYSVSMLIEGHGKGVFSGFQGYLKTFKRNINEVSWQFQGS